MLLPSNALHGLLVPHVPLPCAPVQEVGHPLQEGLPGLPIHVPSRQIPELQQLGMDPALIQSPGQLLLCRGL